LKGWFAFDLLTSIPISIFILQNPRLGVLRILRIARLPKIFKIMRIAKFILLYLKFDYIGSSRMLAHAGQLEEPSKLYKSLFGLGFLLNP